MWLLILEAIAAMGLLVLIVWWTMYSGPKPQPPAKRQDDDAPSENTPPE